jgi:hypothetical protein
MRRSHALLLLTLVISLTAADACFAQLRVFREDARLYVEYACAKGSKRPNFLDIIFGFYPPMLGTPGGTSVESCFEKNTYYGNFFHFFTDPEIAEENKPDAYWFDLIRRRIREELTWSPQTHHSFTPKERALARMLLAALKRDESPLSLLRKDLMLSFIIPLAIRANAEHVK